MKKVINIQNKVDSVTAIGEFINSCYAHCVDNEHIVEIKVVRAMDSKDTQKLGKEFGVTVTTVVDSDL